MKASNVFPHLLIALLFVISAGCNSSGSDNARPPANATSTNYPYLTTALKITHIQNIYDLTSHDVTVELGATGPTPIVSVSLWIKSKTDPGNFDYLELQNIGGTTWSATTNSYLGLPAGSYYIDSIELQDGDPFDGGLVRSGWYFGNSVLSTTHYVIDQRLTNWDTQNLAILEHNAGVSNIPIATFTLP